MVTNKSLTRNKETERERIKWLKRGLIYREEKKEMSLYNREAADLHLSELV